jgi:hypothetical protein
VLVEVTGHHDPGFRRTQGVQLGASLAGQHPQIPGVDPDRAQIGAGGGDRVGHAAADVVGVDEQGGGPAQRGDLGAERGLLPVVGAAVGGADDRIVEQIVLAVEKAEGVTEILESFR